MEKKRKIILIVLIIFIAFLAFLALWYYNNMTTEAAMKASQPLYHLQDIKGSNFYTMSYGEKQWAILFGLSDKGVVGCMFNSMEKNTVPLYRLYMPEKAYQRIYTTSSSAKDEAISKGYTYENITGYLYPAELESTIPLYDLHDTNKDIRIYTANETEKETAIESGYVEEGIIGYLYPAQDWNCY